MRLIEDSSTDGYSNDIAAAGSGAAIPREKPAHLAPRPKPAHLQPREKPAHLQQSASTGRAVDPPPAPTIVRAKTSDTESTAGWGKVSKGPWAGSQSAASRAPDARSVAESSVDGWGNVSNGPWGDGGKSSPSKSENGVRAASTTGVDEATNGPRGNTGAAKGKAKQSWADLMDEEDEKTVLSSDAIPEEPW